MRHPAWDVRRHSPSGVTPLEVWNLPVRGRELWELTGVRPVEEDRRAGVPDFAITERLVSALTVALDTLVHRHAPEAVYLSGGLAAREGFAAALTRATATLPCPVLIAPEPRFAPVRAGLALLEATHAAAPLAVDVGQTSIKCASPGATRVFERDTDALPLLFIGMPRPVDGHHVASAVRFISGAVRAFLQETSRTPDALCLALPCPLDAALVPGGCTYGWEQHASLVTDILRDAGLPDRGGTVLVLNDAELAAEAARRDARVTGRRVLCITLGFGPGGALLERN